MKRLVFLIAASVLLLAIPMAAAATPEPPVPNVVFATVEYVEERITELRTELQNYVDEQIGSGAPVALPPWEVPQAYEFSYWEEYLALEAVGQLCVLSEDTQQVVGASTFVILRLSDKNFYESGACWLIVLPQLQPEDLPESDFDVDIWFEWMGETKKATYTVSPPEPPTEASY